MFVTSVAMAICSTLCGALLVETGHRHHGSAGFVNQQWLWYSIAQMAAVLLAARVTFMPSFASRRARAALKPEPAPTISAVWNRSGVDTASPR